jgi:hypothetical protein
VKKLVGSYLHIFVANAPKPYPTPVTWYFDVLTHKERAGKTQSVYQGSAAWNRGSFLCTGRKIVLFSVQTGSGAHAPAVEWIPAALSQEVNLLGLEADYLPTSST